MNNTLFSLGLIERRLTGWTRVKFALLAPFYAVAGLIFYLGNEG